MLVGFVGMVEVMVEVVEELIGQVMVCYVVFVFFQWFEYGGVQCWGQYDGDQY